MPLNPVLYRHLWHEMTATTTLRAPRLEPIRAAWARYALACTGLAGIVVVVLLIVWPFPYLWYAQSVVLPHYEESFGFHGGYVQTSKDSSIYAILEVVPEGRLARAGVKNGDIPVDRHGGGAAIFLDALEQASAGREGEFLVVSNLDLWFRGEDIRKIVVSPSGRLK